VEEYRNSGMGEGFIGCVHTQGHNASEHGHV
jgi:hypothetical protein